MIAFVDDFVASHISRIRVAAGALAAILFGVIVVMSFSETEARAFIVEYEDGQANGTSSELLKCGPITSSALDADKSWEKYDKTAEFYPSWDQDFADVSIKCADARTRQGFRMMVLAIPTILLGFVAATPRGRSRETSALRHDQPAGDVQQDAEPETEDHGGNQ